MPPSRPAGGAGLDEHRAVGAQRQPGGAVADRLRRLRRPARQLRRRCPRGGAAQAAHQGQMPQAGARGVQMVAPRSITAWA